MSRSLVLSADGLIKHFTLRSASRILQRQGTVLKAVDGVSFRLARGETLAVVGESGCGKSTLARLLMMTLSPTAGSIVLHGENLSDLSRRARRSARRHIQMVFQDPYASLHPRMSARQIIAEPLRNLTGMAAAERDAKVRQIFDRVGLPASALDRYPHEFSGGQRQRIAIARAVVLGPAVVVADEPVSALDLSVQGQILNLLGDLQSDMGVSYLFISHDLGVVEYVADTVAVMYLGRFVEVAPRAMLFGGPRHPYTRMLLNAIPSLDPTHRRDWTSTAGELPSPVNLPSGCRFRTRCPLASEICARVEPQLAAGADGHLVACHHADQPAPDHPPAQRPAMPAEAGPSI